MVTFLLVEMFCYFHTFLVSSKLELMEERSSSFCELKNLESVKDVLPAQVEWMVNASNLLELVKNGVLEPGKAINAIAYKMSHENARFRSISNASQKKRNRLILERKRSRTEI